jgi:hypothetical protein
MTELIICVKTARTIITGSNTLLILYQEIISFWTNKQNAENNWVNAWKHELGYLVRFWSGLNNPVKQRKVITILY